MTHDRRLRPTAITLPGSIVAINEIDPAITPRSINVRGDALTVGGETSSSFGVSPWVGIYDSYTLEERSAFTFDYATGSAFATGTTPAGTTLVAVESDSVGLAVGQIAPDGTDYGPVTPFSEIGPEPLLAGNALDYGLAPDGFQLFAADSGVSRCAPME